MSQRMTKNLKNRYTCEASMGGKTGNSSPGCLNDVDIHLNRDLGFISDTYPSLWEMIVLSWQKFPCAGSLPGTIFANIPSGCWHSLTIPRIMHLYHWSCMDRTFLYIYIYFRSRIDGHFFHIWNVSVWAFSEAPSSHSTALRISILETCRLHFSGGFI